MDIGNFTRTSADGVLLSIYVTPKSGKVKIKGEREGRLWVSLTSAPEDGKANAELIKFLSKILNVPKSNIVIKSGQTGRRKSVLIQNASMEDLIKRFSDL